MSTDVQPIRGFFAPDPVRRGYHAAHRPNERNHCPGCGRSQWIVGRLLAECAFCEPALPLADGGMTGAGLFRLGWRAPEALAA